MPADPAAPPGPVAPFRPRTPVVIGIVGGIAAGKSTVAACFTAHGLVHIDADAHARAVSQEPAVTAAVQAEFGPGVVREGLIDRAALANLVFQDAGARGRLEAILHPRIRAGITAAIETARRDGRSVLLDAPLLIEGGLVRLCDQVVFVAVDRAQRAARAAQRGWADGELDRREAAQLPLADKLARATAVVDNNGDRAQLAAQVAALLERWQQKIRP